MGAKQYISKDRHGQMLEEAVCVGSDASILSLGVLRSMPCATLNILFISLPARNGSIHETIGTLQPMNGSQLICLP